MRHGTVSFRRHGRTHAPQAPPGGIFQAHAPVFHFGRAPAVGVTRGRLINERDLAAALTEFVQLFIQRLRPALRRGNEQRLPAARFKQFDRHHFAGELALVKLPNELLGLHDRAAARPLRFGVIQYAYRRSLPAPVDQLRRALHGGEQAADIRVVGRIYGEMRRRVRVRRGFQAESVGSKVVYAPGQKQVRGVAHLPRVLLPSVRPEALAQRPPRFFGVQRGGGGGHLGQHEAEKVVLRLEALGVPGVETSVKLRPQLVQHEVHARHGLPAYGPEKVPRALSQTGMGVVLLYHVADVFKPPLTAPPAYRLRVVFRVQPAHLVHEGVADEGSHFPYVVPQPGQQPAGVHSHFTGQNIGQVRPPGHGQAGIFPQYRVGAAPRP